MEELFLSPYLTSSYGIKPEDLEKMKSFFNNFLKKEAAEKEELRRKKELSYRYKFVPVEFTEQDKIKYNIDYQHYYCLTYDGIRITDRMFTKGSLLDKSKNLNESDDRYVVLSVVLVGKYDEEIMKHSKSKSPYYYYSVPCIFDKETQKIIFEPTQNQFDNRYLDIKKNIATYGHAIYYLPTMELIYESASGYSKMLMCESEDNICVKSSEFNEKGPITIINKITGKKLLF